MAYFAPYIDATGFHIPTFNDIFQQILTQYTNIYGQSVSTNIATSDMQDIYNRALMTNDAFLAAQLAFNGMSPVGAIGSQQDTLYKLNGIARNGATYSSAVLSITGTPFATLTGRVAQDQNGNLWNLPSSFTLDGAGNATVIGICSVYGPISAAMNTINIRNNPTAGWLTVNNTLAATPGVASEPDSSFRARQAISVALPSQTEVNGTLAAIGATAGVTRYATGINTPGGPGTSIENPTGGPDFWGNPAHSITMVVEGGTDLAVATAIYVNKTPGALTNGTTSVVVTDPITGSVMTISFYRPTYKAIYVTLVVTPLSGYTTATTTAIKNAIAAYLNTLSIGENVTISALYGAALAVMPNLSQPQFSITAMYADEVPTGIGLFAIGGTAGTGYTVGDIVTVAGGTGGTIRITAVAAGVPTALELVTPGTGYALATNAATSGGSGTGLQINITKLGANTSTDISLNFFEVTTGDPTNVVVSVT